MQLDLTKDQLKVLKFEIAQSVARCERKFSRIAKRRNDVVDIANTSTYGPQQAVAFKESSRLDLKLERVRVRKNDLLSIYQAIELGETW